MTSQSSSFEDIMDTARWMAFYRAIESERPDALFHDPFARQLAGKRGEEIAAILPFGRQSAWITTIRTRVFDEIIMQAVDSGADTVLNLAAGLDTRPYRLALPASLRWIEVDFFSILSYKQEKLSNEQPLCSLEHVAMDLANREERKKLFARVGASARLVLVVAEGFLLYLEADQVAALATDLYAIPSFAWWLTALASPLMMKLLPPALKGHLAAGKTRMQFAPEEGAAFFQPYGWKNAAFHASQDEAHRLNREIPLWWLVQSLIYLASKRDQRPADKAGGFLLLSRT
jgi:methyltransferase (TIGR00027 family)